MGGIWLQYSSKGTTLFSFYRKFSMSLYIYIYIFFFLLIIISHIAETPLFYCIVVPVNSGS